MTLQQEFSSWLSPGTVSKSSAPSTGSKAPSTSQLAFPDPNGKPTILTFLRHCGCPFAEKTFLRLRSAASAHSNLCFLAISHSDQQSTDRWLEGVGGAGSIEIIVDDDRDIYAAWGLGVADFWHVLGPWGLWNVYKTGKEDGIWNRPTESGSRWQKSGSFAVDDKGFVRWGQPAPSADWLPDFEEAVRVLEA
ncbi:MAG: hypothetical protein Q9186_006085 [Xanthomendoza sp. 1 TL-2023]